MIHHAWTIVCDRVIVDQASNNLSLDVVEQLEVTIEGVTSPDPVVVPVNLYVVTMWYRDGESSEVGRARARMVAPGEVVSGGADLDLSLSELRLRTTARLPGLPVKSSGVHYFTMELWIDDLWQQVARVPLQIVLKGE